MCPFTTPTRTAVAAAAFSLTPHSAAQSLQMKHTLGRDTIDDPYHIGIIRDKLTRGLPAVFPALADELMRAVSDHIPATDDGAPDTLN